MRNQIKYIIEKYVFEVGDEIRGIKQTTKEIMQLVCYRELRGILYPLDLTSADDINSDSIIEIMKNDYSKETILTAIEQVKKEYHDKKG